MECRNKITLINDCAIAPLKSQNGSYEKLQNSSQGLRNGIELELCVWEFAALKAPLSSLLCKDTSGEQVGEETFIAKYIHYLCDCGGSTSLTGLVLPWEVFAPIVTMALSTPSKRSLLCKDTCTFGEQVW